MSRRKRSRLAGLSAVAALGLMALPGVANATVTSNVDAAGKLTISSNAGDAITVTCVAGKVQVNGATIGSDPNCSAITAIEVNGGPQANLIDLSGVASPQFTALATPPDVDGGGGNDTINGSQLADILTGGADNDRITGDNNPGGTRDTSVGGDGDDTLVWNPGDGDDTNEGGAGNDTIEVNGGNGGEQFTVAPSASAGRVLFDRTGPTPPGPFNLDIGTAERLDLNANGGDDTITGRRGVAGLIKTTLNGGDDDDRIKGTDARDRISGGNGFDLINSRDRAEDKVDCGSGFDLALVDKRDTVRGCEIVLGGFLRVKHSAKSASVAGGTAALNLTCLAKGTCKGKVNLIHGGRSIGSKSYRLKGKKSKIVRVKIGKRGLRLLANASQKGLKVKLRIDAKDSAGNGWRTTDALRLKG